MKKQFILLLCITLFSGSLLLAQDKDTSAVTLPGVTITSKAMVNKQIDKAFKTAFPEATQLRWYQLDKDFLAKFILKDMDHNALFTKNGYMKYDISFGHEHNLPDEIKDQVHSAYKDCTITRAINLKGDGRDIWVVNLEALKYYYSVSIEEGEINEINKIWKTE
ncbi:MAG: hypothetical protein KGO81_03250 [Bacteroidota bacterium]|nr:hypothetical protein [Bacteroidota bacterium]